MDNQDQEQPLTVNFFFPSPVYHVEKPEFLSVALEVANEALKHDKRENPMEDLYPVTQSNDFSNHPKIGDLARYISKVSFDILLEQGYNMDYFATAILDMWAQEHLWSSSHVEHVHGHGSTITGFYILEAPEDCSQIVIHDPRPAKRQINLPEKDLSVLSIGSLSAQFNPKAGSLYLINSYIPHEFTRHPSKTPFKFIHFNVGAVSRSMFKDLDQDGDQQACSPQAVEVI